MTVPARAAAEIKRRGQAVVFIDTCSILDLSRGPRENFGAPHAAAAVQILKLTELGRLTLVLPQQVELELSTWIDDVKRDGFKSVSDLNDNIAKLRKPIADIIQVYGGTVPALPRLSEHDFIVLAGNIVARFRAAAYLSITSDAAKIRAVDRVNLGKAPSHTSKQSVKDCLVLESCFETLMGARSEGFSAPAYFLSSNTSDYCSQNKRDLHPDLIEEFTNLTLEYYRDFAELRSNQQIKDLL
jgi:PIN domain